LCIIRIARQLASSSSKQEEENAEENGVRGEYELMEVEQASPEGDVGSAEKKRRTSRKYIKSIQQFQDQLMAPEVST
jgi:hypothetical protein